jgi:MoaA/NifB/PqqE/SkfB family radical SAM enzyme
MVNYYHLVRQVVLRALSHRDFFRTRTLLRAGFCFLPEYGILKRVFSAPKIINLLLTRRCNLNCSICHAHDLRIEEGNPELSTAELEKLVLDSRSFSPDWFFSGGEPFLRDDLPELLSLIKKYGMKASAVTNGTLLNEKYIKRISPGSLGAVFFSILGPEKEHDEITGQEGSFGRVMENIRLLSELLPECRIYVNAPLTESTLTNLNEFLDSLRQQPISFLRFSQLNFLTPQELEAHERFAEKHGFINLKAHSWVQAKAPPVKDLILSRLTSDLSQPFSFDVKLSAPELAVWYSEHFNLRRLCHYIWHTAYIQPDGMVMSCQFLQEPFGNIREQGLLEIWKSERFQEFRRLIRKNLAPGCARCCKL